MTNNYEQTVVIPHQEAIQAAVAAQQNQTVQSPPAIIPTPQIVPTQAVAPTDIQEIITHWANVYGVSPSLLLEVAACESGFNLQAYNPSGATGLFQFMPSTFASHGGINIYDANDQAMVAAKMFSEGESGQWACK